MAKAVLFLCLSGILAWGAKKPPIARPASKPPVYKEFKNEKKGKPKVKWGAQRDLNP